MSKNQKGNNASLFNQTIRQMDRERAMQSMRAFPQHKGNSTYQHVRNVAFYSFFLAEKFGCRVDEVSLARGALLHDYYLYEREKRGISDYKHGVTHPQVALENARIDYDLNKKEENIIRSHMWPLTLLHPPLSKEAWLVSMADKCCAIREMFGDTKVIIPAPHSRWVRGVARLQMKRFGRWILSAAGN